MLAGNVAERSDLADLHDHCLLGMRAESEAGLEENIGACLAGRFSITTFIVGTPEVLLQVRYLVGREQDDDGLDAAHCRFDDVLDVRVSALRLIDGLLP